MGRLTNIDIADAAWNDTNISYTTTADNLFLQQVTKGNYKKQTYYDSLLRPIYTLEQDITSSASNKHVTQRFNHNNQVVFSSYPSNVKNTTVGILNEYDALGRITETRSTDNEIVTTREYLSGNEMITTDSNGYSTTTAYLAYGSPAQKLPAEIRSPEQVITSIIYNYLDQVTAITQGGVTETRIYDELGQLCKTHRPDVGMTAFGYDSQRRPVWQYSGNLSNSGSCAITSAQREQAMSISYDNQGNIWKQQFSDNTPDKTFKYDDSGLLKSLIAGAVTWSYSYDNQNNLTRETLSVDNKSFNIGWSYNENNHLKSITYPSNRTVEYAPNALGQPTKANNYATQLSYTPSGQIESMRLGNNVVKLTEFDVHSRPTLLRDSLSNQDIINYSLGYDGNSNLSYQNDNVNSQRSISSLSYDGLNRLTGASGSWGIADFQYDELGNITRKQLGNKAINYHYQNNRLTSVSGSVVKAFDYDSRGNMVQSGNQSLTFNRLNQVTHLNSNQYTYDGYDRRVKAVTNSGTTYSVYSKNGKLIYQVNIDKNDTTDHIYIANKLIAKVTNGLRKPTLNTSEPVLGTGKVSFSWNSIPTATRYELEKKTGSSWSNIYSGSGFSYIATETATGSYEYRLKACNSKKCSSYDNSELINILFKPNAPSAVSVPVTTSKNGNISISWNQPSHTDNFKLYQKSGANSWRHIKSLSAVNYSVSGLGNGSYTYAVEACNVAGCSAKRISNSISVLYLPAIPSSINAPKGTDTDGAYTVSWPSVSTATNYQLSQKVNSGAWTIVSDGTNLSKAFSGKGNASYQYAVRACNASGCSAYKHSSTFSVLLPPAVPSSITVPTGNDVDGAYTVSWSAVSTATKYQLVQKVNSGGWITVSDNSNRSKGFSGKGNAKYQYAVRACNASGCSGYRYSSTFNVLLPPPVPSSISVPASTDSDGAYTVSWPVASTATRYQLSQKVNTGAWVSVSDGTNRSKAFSGKGNAKYQYAVRACNTSGCSGYRYSVTFNVLLPPSVPSSINVPTSTDIDGAFSVSWNSATSATSYSLYQSLNGGSWTTVTSGNFTSKALSGKGNGSYRYAVKACNSSGCSGLKTSASFTVLHPPKTPSSLSLPKSDFDGSFNMNWSASSTTTRYELREKVNTGSWKTIGTNFKSTSYTRSGRGSANYQYGVRACNTSGCSSWRYSGTLTNTLMPSSMSAPSVDHDGRFYISWGNVSTRTYYKVQEKTGSGSWKNLLSSTTSTGYDRKGLTNTSYQYRVAACNVHGCSGYRTSGTVVVTLPPLSISYASKDHDGSFSVSWSKVSTATSYELQQRFGSGSWSTVYTGSSTSAWMSGRADGTYYYRVIACRGSSCSSPRDKGNYTMRVIRPNLNAYWSPNYLTRPGTGTLKWSANGADKCSSGYIGNNAAASGSKNVYVGSTRTHTVTCYFGSKSISKSAKITVKYSGGGGGVEL